MQKWLIKGLRLWSHCHGADASTSWRSGTRPVPLPCPGRILIARP